jgi:hypothetical protein
MATTKVTRNMLNTGIVDNSNATAITIDSSENVAIGHTTTTGSKFAICDGANSQIQFFPEISTDTNLTQHYDPTAAVYINSETRAASHAWKIGTSETMRIDTSGNTLLQTGGAALQWQNGYQTITGAADSNDLTYRTYQNHIWKTGTGASSTTDGTERMRINSSGNLLIAGTVDLDSSHIAIHHATGKNGISFLAPNTSAHMALQFYNSSGGRVGYIQYSNTATTFSTSSDYRLKENITPIENGLERLNKLNPVKFDWKDKDTSSEGFIAHEAQEVFPDAVTGEKDGEEMQGMDYGRITPLLVKAIQEQQTIIEDLKARIETLEG